MIKLPRTQHIEGSRLAVGGSDPDAVKFATLKSQFLVIEEKLDGTGVTLFFDNNLDLQIWHRGSKASGKEFDHLHTWANAHYDALFDLLSQRFVLFGEWMYAKHSIYYDKLPLDPETGSPQYFLESDIFDTRGHIWLSTVARHAMLTAYPFIKSVPVLKECKPQSLQELTSLIGKSTYQTDEWEEMLLLMARLHKLNPDQVLRETDRSNLMEGLYIKHEGERHVIGRYKYVRYEFLKTILDSGTHLIDRPLIHNTYLV